MQSWPGVGEAPERRRRAPPRRGRRPPGRSAGRCPSPRGCRAEGAPRRRRPRPSPASWRLQVRGRGVGHDGVDARVPDQRLGLGARQRRPPRSRPRGQGPASASRTSAVVRRARREGRARTRVARHQRRGRHHRGHPDRRVGRVPAEHHPVGRPLELGRPAGGRHRPRAGSPRRGPAGRRGGRAPTPARGGRSGAAGPGSATARSTTASPIAASAARERAAARQALVEGRAPPPRRWAARGPQRRRRGGRWGPRARRLAGRAALPAGPPGAGLGAGGRGRLRRALRRCSRCGWTREGLVCAPRAAPELAAPALARCPLPRARWPRCRAGPTRRRRWWPAGTGAGPATCAAPAGVRELVQVAGRGLRPGRPRHHGDVPRGARGPRARAGGRRRLRLGPARPGLGAPRAWAGDGLRPRPARGRPGGAQPGRRRASAGAVTLRRGPLEALAPEELAGRCCWPTCPPPPTGRSSGASGRPRRRPCSRVCARRRPARWPRPTCGPRPAPGGAGERGGFCCLVMARPAAMGE